MNASAGLPAPPTWRSVLRYLASLAAFAAALVLVLPGRAQAPPTSHHLTPAARAFREQTYRTHPCLAHIVDVEDGDWDPTVDYGGGHGNTSESYGLPQANPGTKMGGAGADWASSRRTQLRWMKGYAVGRYGSECGAWAYRASHGSY